MSLFAIIFLQVIKQSKQVRAIAQNTNLAHIFEILVAMQYSFYIQALQ